MNVSFLVIPLVVVLGFIEFFSRGDLGGDRPAEAPGRIELFDVHLSGFFLLLAVKKDYGSVLSSDVRALSVDLGGIMKLEEKLQELLVADHGGIEGDLDRFRMPGFPSADKAVSGIFYVPARVSDPG